MNYLDPTKDPARFRRPRLAIVLAFLVPLALACGGDEEGPATAAATAPEARPSVELLPMPQPDLAALAPPVRTQIRERQLWQHRIDQNPESTVENRASAIGELGNLYHAYGLLGEAEISYRNAERLDPESFRWPYFLCQLYGRTNKLEAAIKACRRAVELDEADVPVRVRLAELLAFSNRGEEAEPIFRQAIALDDGAAAAHFGLAQLAASREDFAAAAEGFEKVLELQPEATAIHGLAAQAYRDLGETAKAEAHLAKAGEGEVKLKEPLMATLQGLSVGQQRFRQEGQKAFQEKRFEDSVEAFRRAVAADPLYADLRVSLAAALVQTGEPAAALEQYELATKIAPTHPRANFGAAFLLQRSGQNAQAAERYRRVLGVEPDNRNARVNLAQTLFESEDYVAALEELELLLGKEPGDVPLRLAKVGALIQQKRYFDAEATLDEGLELDGNNPQLLQAQARLLATSPQAEQRDGKRAVELAETLVNLEKRPEYVETLAMALAGAGRFEEAIVLQQALIESAAAAERKGLEDSLTATLERYRSGQPALPPWQVGPRAQESGA